MKPPYSIHTTNTKPFSGAFLSEYVDCEESTNYVCVPVDSIRVTIDGIEYRLVEASKSEQK